MTVRRAADARSLLRTAFFVAAAIGFIAIVVGGLVAGVDGLAAAGLGAALVLSFLLVGQFRLAQAARGHAGMGAAWLLFGYVARVLLLLMAFVAVTSAGAPDRRILGMTVIAVALGWTVGAVWTWSRWRPLVVDVVLPGDRTNDPSTTQR